MEFAFFPPTIIHFIFGTKCFSLVVLEFFKSLRLILALESVCSTLFSLFFICSRDHKRSLCVPTVSNQHYVDRLCNISHQLTHRSRSETSPLCIFWVSNELLRCFFPTLPAFWGGSLDMLGGPMHWRLPWNVLSRLMLHFLPKTGCH